MTVSDVDASPAATPGSSRPDEQRHRPRWVVAVAIVAVVAVLALVVRSCVTDDGGGSADPVPSTIGAPTVTAIDDAVNKAVASQSQVVAEVYRKIQPSVVEVDVQKAGGTTDAAGDEHAGLGTGVIVNQDGSILTAFHVVDQATSIEITYADGKRSAATVAETDPDHDIAVLEPATLPSVVVPAVLGGDGVAVGMPVVAVGNPLGLDDTTTSGVISALGRSIRADTGRQLDGLIQFDAAVNPGSSGGPLLDQKGEVVGIVIALADPSKDGYFIGIGFAVPIGTAVATGGGGNQPPK